MNNNSVVADSMDACDLSHTILLTMATYHDLIRSHFKVHLDSSPSYNSREVMDFLHGLDGLFESIRSKNETLQKFLLSQNSTIDTQQST